MRYLPSSPSLRREMLDQLGITSIDELFSHIPEYCRLERTLRIPAGQSEAEIIASFQAWAGQNAPGFTSFLGAGAYYHFRPTHIEALTSRSEWFSAYTPYQPEISQGTLQAIFEFQTMICQLTGQEVANASVYDGSTAMAEAVLMAARITGRHHAVLAKTVHPQYREVLRTYTLFRDFPTTTVGYQSDGRVDWAALEAAIGEQTAAIVLQSPNFFGTVEDWQMAAEVAHRHGALLIAVITDPVSLGLLPPPEAADIVAMELQGFGLPVSFGGPYAGVLASKERYVRSLPGRLVGEARDDAGRRGFVLTLSTREQHIRREKATSNICTNQALCALMASIFMASYGREGLRELALQNLSKAHYAAEAFQRAGIEVLFPAPRFHEMVIRPRRPLAEIQNELLAEKIIPGLPLDGWYPELTRDGQPALLVCITETAPRAHIDQLVAACGSQQPARAEERESVAQMVRH